MSKRLFYMPFIFADVRKDTRRLSKSLRWDYLHILEVFWMAEGDFRFDELETATGIKQRDIDNIFKLVPALEVVDGNVNHPIIREELLRVIRKSLGAQKAANARWHKGVEQ